MCVQKSHVKVRFPSAVSCCRSMSMETTQVYSPEWSTLVSIRVKLAMYMKSTVPGTSANTDSSLPVALTGLPLCNHSTESRLGVIGSDECTSQVSTNDCPNTGLSGMRRVTF